MPGSGMEMQGTGNLLGGFTQQTGTNFAPYNIPVVGNFFTNPQEQFQQAQLQEAGRQYGAMRPEAQNAQMNALRQSQSLYAPTNNALGEMYGPGAQMDMQAASQNPMSDRGMQLGNPSEPTPMTGDEGHDKTMTGTQQLFQAAIPGASMWSQYAPFRQEGPDGGQSYLNYITGGNSPEVFGEGKRRREQRREKRKKKKKGSEGRRDD